MNSTQRAPRHLFALIIATAVVAAAFAAPAGAAPKKCAKSKVAWKLDGQLTCVADRVGGASSPPEAALARTWIATASRQSPTGGLRLAPALRRAAPDVGRKLAAALTGAAPSSSSSGPVALRKVLGRMDKVIGREELGDGVVVEGRLKGRHYDDETGEFEGELEVSDRDGNATRYTPDLRDLFSPEDPVGCPTAKGVVRARTQGGAGGTVIKMRRGRVLGSKTEHQSWVIESRGQVGDDAKLRSLVAQISMTTSTYERGLQMKTTLRASVKATREGAPAIAGTPTVEASIRAAGHTRAEELEAEAKWSREVAGVPELAQAITGIAEDARRHLLEAEPGWYRVPNECAELSWDPGAGIKLEVDETRRVTGTVISRKGGIAASGSIVVFDVPRGHLIPITPTFTQAAPASFIAGGDEPDAQGFSVYASAIGTSTAGRARATWSAEGTPRSVPRAYRGTISSIATSEGHEAEFSGTAEYTRTSLIRAPDGSLYAWYDLTAASLGSARETLGPTEGCRYEALGGGGRIESGDLELRLLPNGEVVYTLLYDLAVPSVYELTDCPPESAGDPFEGDIVARLNAGRPGPLEGRMRPAREAFLLEEHGVGDVTDHEGIATTASWSLTPEF